MNRIISFIKTQKTRFQAIIICPEIRIHWTYWGAAELVYCKIFAGILLFLLKVFFFVVFPLPWPKGFYAFNVGSWLYVWKEDDNIPFIADCISCWIRGTFDIVSRQWFHKKENLSIMLFGLLNLRLVVYSIDADSDPLFSIEYSQHFYWYQIPMTSFVAFQVVARYRNSIHHFLSFFFGMEKLILFPYEF